MAYADEPSINTMLLEGSVKVSKGRLSQMIVPRQQARISADIQVEYQVEILMTTSVSACATS